MTHCKPDLKIVVTHPRAPLVILRCPRVTVPPWIFFLLSSQGTIKPIKKRLGKVYFFFLFSVAGKLFCLTAALSYYSKHQFLSNQFSKFQKAGPPGGVCSTQDGVIVSL